MKAIRVDSLHDVLRPKASDDVTMRVHVKAGDVDHSNLAGNRTEVPFLDLDVHHASRREEFSRAIESVIDAGAFAGGEFVDRHSLAVGSRYQCSIQ